MANLRQIKKDINYVVNEVLYDCYLALHFHSDKEEKIIALMEDTVDVRNEFFEMVNNPADKHNKSLVKKHYSFVRREFMDRIDGIFDTLSDIVNS